MMVRRPDAAFVLAHPAHFVAFGFGSGLSPIAPGTVGTALTFPIYFGLAHWLSPLAIFLLCPILFVMGIWACERTGRALGVADHGGMNWDEIVAFLLVLAFTPPSLAWQIGAFVAFRFFDIVKPPPIGYFDRTMKGGFGVMLDDLLAAFYTLLALALARQLIG